MVKVCKLEKSLYGLKQTPRAWFGRFTKVLKRLGFSQGHSNHTMLYRHTQEGKVTIMIVQVDNIILIGDDDLGMKKLKENWLMNSSKGSW